jgi:hypothetical protein
MGTPLIRHLLWHVGVATAAVGVLSLFGMPLSSALPIGMMAGCVAMVLGAGHGGHRHESSNRPSQVHREVEHR